LRIEEFLPQDEFYNPTHKDFVKRQRKKRNLDAAVVMTLDNEPMNIVWKDLPMDPYENLTKLSQFIGAYAMVTVDKATEVQMRLKERNKELCCWNNN